MIDVYGLGDSFMDVYLFPESPSHTHLVCTAFHVNHTLIKWFLKSSFTKNHEWMNYWMRSKVL